MSVSHWEGVLTNIRSLKKCLTACAGLKGIINNSQWCADLHSRSPQSRRHALAEAVLDAFPTPVVHLRGATYNINMFAQVYSHDVLWLRPHLASGKGCIGSAVQDCMSCSGHLMFGCPSGVTPQMDPSCIGGLCCNSSGIPMSGFNV